MLEIYVSAVPFIKVVQPAGERTLGSVSAAVLLARGATVRPALKAVVWSAAGREVYSSRILEMT